MREVHQRPRNSSKHGSGTCATRPRTMQSADNNFFQLRSTFTARTPPQRTPPQQSTRFCQDTWRVYPAPSTLIIIHPDLSWPTLDCVQKAPVCVRLHRRKKRIDTSSPTKTPNSPHTHTHVNQGTSFQTIANHFRLYRGCGPKCGPKRTKSTDL